MKNKQTTIYLHFREPIDFSVLHDAFPDSASYFRIMDDSCIITSYLTYKTVLDLMEHHFPDKEYFICVASRHYHVKPAS